MDEHPDQVIAVVADGDHWGRRGIAIAMVEPAAEGGVRVGVRGDPCLAQLEMREHYDFPVTCYRWVDRPAGENGGG